MTKITSKNPVIAPTTSRSLASFCQHHSFGNTAFYLGAGVDIQLAKDAGVSDSDWKVFSWSGLIEKLEPFGSNVDQDEVKRFAKDWPTETAFVKYLNGGRHSLVRSIQDGIELEFEPELEADFTRTFCKLLSQSNLVVTTNFSSHGYRALERYVRDEATKQRIVVLEREDLSTFQFPVPESFPKTIYFVYLHGRCNGRSAPIFDAWGYSLANSDKYYRNFLRQLFYTRNVATIGCSWSDIPLRNESAFVFRTNEHVRISHIGLNPAKKPNNESIGTYRKWSVAMRGVYGVDLIRTEFDEQEQLLSKIDSYSSEVMPEIDSDLPAIADFFDFCGDYESQVLQHWLLKSTRDAKMNSESSRITTSVDRLYRRLYSEANPKNWTTISRIERHLRHFAHLYFETSELKGRMWRKLAEYSKEIWDNIDDERLKFDFLCGKFECFDRNNPVSLDLTVTESVFSRRLEKAQFIWPEKTNEEKEKSAEERETDTKVPELFHELIDLGWESIAAKVLLDSLFDAVESIRRATEAVKEKKVYQLLNGLELAEATARSVGCFRRQVKAVSLMAIWMPDAKEGRRLILSKQRAAENKPIRVRGNDFGAAHFEVEPIMQAALAASLLACEIKILLTQDSYDSVKNLVSNKAKALLNESGVASSSVISEKLRWWLKFVPKEIEELLKLAIDSYEES